MSASDDAEISVCHTIMVKNKGIRFSPFMQNIVRIKIITLKEYEPAYHQSKGRGHLIPKVPPLEFRADYK
jgi:hypothetical protein